MNQRTLRILGGGLIFLSFLWLVAGAFYWTRMPRVFQATARFTLPEDRDLNGPHFLQKEFERVQSKTVLNHVIANLNLKTKWEARYGKEQELDDDSTYRLLKQRVKVVQTRGTTLIEAQVRGEDAIEAAQIANEIAQVNYQQELARKKERAANDVKLFRAELESHNQRITNAQALVERLRKELNISREDDAASASMNNQKLTEYTAYFVARSNLNELKQARHKFSLKGLDEIVQRPVSSVEIIDSAVPPLRPISPNPMISSLNLLPGFFLGFGGLLMLFNSRTSQ